MKYTKFLLVALLPTLVACNFKAKQEEQIKAKLEAEYQHKLDSMKLAEANAKIEALQNAKPAAAASRPAAPVKSSAATCEFSWLSQRRVTESDIAGMSSSDIAILRNAIYAMHGRKFVKAVYRNYFSQFAWYRPLYDEVQLTSLEQQNVAFLKSYE